MAWDYEHLDQCCVGVMLIVEMLRPEAEGAVCQWGRQGTYLLRPRWLNRRGQKMKLSLPAIACI